MVGSRRTWNTDEPGLGRPKALPSSAPCRASVIWMVLSGRHMPVNVHWLHTQRLEVLHALTWPHATSINPPASHGDAHLYTSVHQAPPSQPSISNPCLYPPPSRTICPCCDLITSQTAPGHLTRCMCYWVCCVFTEVRMLTSVPGSALHKIM